MFKRHSTLELWPVHDLKRECGRLGLQKGGAKEDLVTRLLRAHQSLSVNELKTFCRQAGLPISGTKDELLDRLFDYEAQHANDRPVIPKMPPKVVIQRKYEVDSDDEDAIHSAAIFSNNPEFHFCFFFTGTITEINNITRRYFNSCNPLQLDPEELRHHHRVQVSHDSKGLIKLSVHDCKDQLWQVWAAFPTFSTAKAIELIENIEKC
jgi:hypothetical protein